MDISHTPALPLREEAGRGLPSSCWRGILRLNGAEALGREGDDVIASRHKFGRGEVIWIPSPIEIGARLSEDYAPYEALLSEIVGQGAFAAPADNVFMRQLQSKHGRLTVLVNAGDTEAEVSLNLSSQASNKIDLKHAKLIFGDAKVEGTSRLPLAPHAVAVFRSR